MHGQDWQGRDIGTSTTGSSLSSGSSATVTGSGRDIWNETDGFRYHYRTVSGDFDLIVRVASLTYTHGWAKAGIMARHTLDAGSPHATVLVSAAHGTAFQYRASVNGATESTPPTEDGTAPRWLKLSRRGSDFGGFVSTDGVTWTFAGRYFLTSAPSVLVGLAVTSHNDGTLCTAQFDNVSLFDAPAVATNLRVTHRGENGRIDLAWNDNSSDETGFVIEMADGDDQSTGGFAPVGRVGPNVTQYTAANLGLGWAYDFQVRAVKGEVGNVGEHLVVRTTVPPSGLMVTSTQATAVSLRFYASPGGERFPSRSASGYSLERSVDNATFVEIANNLSSDDNRNVSYTDTGVAAGTTYFYRARYRASNGDVSSYTSVVTTTTPGTGGIAAPTGLTATALSSTEIRLNWTDNATNETDYQIERAADGVSFAMVSFGGGANQVTRTDSGLTPNTTYHYRVRAVNGSAASGYSNVANATTQSTSTVPPAAPSNLVATALSSTEVRLTWTDNSTDETGFTITRSTDGVHWGDALSAGANATSVNDPGRTPGLRYYYRIRAQRQSSAGTRFSSFSNETNVLMPGTPPDTGAWTSTDVGVVGAAGRTAQNGETFVVSGSGHDIWETQDAFHFYARPLTGNGEIYARISALDRTDGWAKAGVMLRTSTEPGAPYAFIFVNPDFTLAWQHREATGGATSFDGRYAWGPIWLRIVRSAGSLLLYYSFDKNRWELVKTVTFQMPTTILAGPCGHESQPRHAGERDIRFVGSAPI